MYLCCSLTCVVDSGDCELVSCPTRLLQIVDLEVGEKQLDLPEADPGFEKGGLNLDLKSDTGGATNNDF